MVVGFPQMEEIIKTVASVLGVLTVSEMAFIYFLSICYS